MQRDTTTDLRDITIKKYHKQPTLGLQNRSIHFNVPGMKKLPEINNINRYFKELK